MTHGTEGDTHPEVTLILTKLADPTRNKMKINGTVEKKRYIYTVYIERDRSEADLRRRGDRWALH
jgi:hypothetical protein